MRSKISLTITAALFSFTFLIAQSKKIDSLNSVLTIASNDTNRINTLNNLTGEFIATGDYKKADSSAHEALTLAEKLNFKMGVAKAYNDIGISNYYRGNLPIALNNYLLALKIYGELGNKNGIEISTGNIGIIYEDQGDYTKALDFYLKALKAEKDIGDKNGMVNTNNNIGVLYEEQHDYPEALKYDSMALGIAGEIGDSNEMAGIIGNIADIYGEQGNYSKSLDCDFKVLRMEKAIRDLGEMAIVIGNIGETYLSEKNYREAQQYLLRGLVLADSVGYLDVIKNMELDFSELYSKTGQFQKALEAYKRYTAAKDSLVNQQKSQQIGRLEASAEYDKKIALQKAAQDNKDALAAAASKRQKIIILLIASIAISLALALFNIFNSLKTTRKQKLLVEKQKVLVELQALRAQMNPHFIFNAINSIKQFIFENDSEAADRHLSRFASLIRKVLENSKQENIPLAEEIRMLELYIQLEMLRFAGKFSYKIIVGEDVNPEKVLISPLIIQPYVENAIWHGLMHRETHGELILKFEKSDDMLKCTIDDNGIGRKRSAEIKKEKQHKSMGLSITKERLEIINMLNQSKMSIHFTDKMNKDSSPDGTRVELFVPYMLNEYAESVAKNRL